MRHRDTVVGVDGSMHCLHAVQWAARDAALHDSDLVLVNAGKPSPLDASDPASILSRAAHVARSSLGPGQHVNVRTHHARGSPAAALLLLVPYPRILVVGSSGGRDPRRRVANVVAAHARYPVAVVPTPASRPTSAVRRAVVLEVDDSSSACGAVVFAFDEAERRRLPLTAVTAPAVESVVDEGCRIDEERCRIHLDARLQRRLSAIEDRCPDVVVHRVIGESLSASFVLDLAREAEFVVVGRGDDGSGRLDPAQRSLLREAPCPTVVVPER
ncbi:universal stress protein [Rhodococcoides corynebacterioides]|uniref:universal stress protein n=1 Tax=Rhodococcoides corynebacterioides TaxID=53972 RepID=UPI0008373CEA|nr:universal stress protein [Rhodococcus corynebacterioides]